MKTYLDNWLHAFQWCFPRSIVVLHAVPHRGLRRRTWFLFGQIWEISAAGEESNESLPLIYAGFQEGCHSDRNPSHQSFLILNIFESLEFRPLHIYWKKVIIFQIGRRQNNLPVVYVSQIKTSYDFFPTKINSDIWIPFSFPYMSLPKIDFPLVPFSSFS